MTPSDILNFLNNNDIFARDNGARITELREGYAKAEMTVEKRHLNGGGVCQGGALFTLADLAFAALANSGNRLTLSIQSNISFLKPAFEADHLTAEAIAVVDHHRTPYCEVKIRNQNNDLICALTGVGYRKDRPVIDNNQ